MVPDPGDLRGDARVRGAAARCGSWRSSCRHKRSSSIHPHVMSMADHIYGVISLIRATIDRTIQSRDRLWSCFCCQCYQCSCHNQLTNKSRSITITLGHSRCSSIKYAISNDLFNPIPFLYKNHISLKVLITSSFYC